MDVVAFKNEMDSICAECAPKGGFPYSDGAQQQWCGSGATDDDIAAAEKRIGAALPQEVREVFKVFSGIVRPMPYFRLGMPGEEKSGSLEGRREAEMAHPLVITEIFPLEQWDLYMRCLRPEHMSKPGDSWLPPLESDTAPEEDAVYTANAIVVNDCDWAPQYYCIGSSMDKDGRYGYVLMDLNPKSELFGRLHNRTMYGRGYYVASSLAVGYYDFLQRLKISLEMALHRPPAVLG